ncbi:MAG: sugar phosphate isomerase/epimerase family protein, partial [Armatimonadota bacterium]
IQFLDAMNSKYLICSGVAQGDGIERYERAAQTFNKVGERCRQAGITFCYHNHAWEFEDLDGVKGIHRLCQLTDPQLVKLCIDVYWVHIGGEDPAEFIQRYADRAGYYHFKDGGPAEEPGARPRFVELGRGTVDLPSAKDAALAAGADWIICEQDRTELDPSDSIRISRAYITERLGL